MLDGITVYGTHQRESKRAAEDSHLVKRVEDMCVSRYWLFLVFVDPNSSQSWRGGAGRTAGHMTTRFGGKLRMIKVTVQAARGVKGSLGDGGEGHATHAQMPRAVAVLDQDGCFGAGGHPDCPP